MSQMTPEELIQWLKDKNWTRTKLGQEIGINFRQISRWTKGHVKIPKWFVKIKHLL